MPNSIEKIPPIRDRIERYNDDNNKRDDSDDDETNYRHHHVMTPPEQDFSYLKQSTHGKRSVHYDNNQIDEYEDRPLRSMTTNESPPETMLRRRYIAHWGLPGLLKISIAIFDEYSPKRLKLN